MPRTQRFPDNQISIDFPKPKPFLAPDNPPAEPAKSSPARPALKLGGIRPNFGAIQGNLKRNGLDATLKNLKARFGDAQAQEYIHQATGFDPSDPKIAAAISTYKDRTRNVSMPAAQRPSSGGQSKSPTMAQTAWGQIAPQFMLGLTPSQASPFEEDHTPPALRSRFEAIQFNMDEYKRRLDKFSGDLNSAIDQNRNNLSAFPDPNRPLIPQEYGWDQVKKVGRALAPKVGGAVDWLLGNH
jgi:hypothetical protein